MSTIKFAPAHFVLALVAGCSGRGERYKAPSVDVDAAAVEAIKLYDADGDGALSQQELAKCPGVLAKLAVYDRNGNGSVEPSEIVQHLNRLLNRTGGTQLDALVLYKGRPLAGANVVLEPEPYLGEAVQESNGVTDGSGSAELAIPPEFVPEHLRRISTVHYGTFKVRITHPTVTLPPKYNTDTELGYETEPGKQTARFDLK